MAADKTHSDSDLVVSFGKGRNIAAYEELVDRWDQRVLAFLVKTTRDYEAAQDLRQEVFLRVFRYGATYKPEYAFTTWFFRIVRNVLSTWRSKESRRLRLITSEEDDTKIVDLRPTPRDRASTSESAELLREAIDRLAPREREVLLLRFDMGMSYREIAEIQKTPETTIKSRIYKLLGELKTALEDIPGVRPAHESS